MWRQRPPKKFGAQGEKSRLRPGPSSHHTQPSGATLTCKGSEPADWAASSGSLHHPRRLAPPGGGGRRKRLGVRRAPAREARSEPGRVATLTSPSTVTSLRNPVRARGGAARSTGPRRRGRATSTSRRASRRTPRTHEPPREKAPKQFTATVASFLLLIPPPTLRESLGEIRGARGICSAVSGPDKVFWRLLCMPMRRADEG
jgi:hypothetical protein